MKKDINRLVMIFGIVCFYLGMHVDAPDINLGFREYIRSLFDVKFLLVVFFLASFSGFISYAIQRRLK